MTDKLRSCGVAYRELIPNSIHLTDRYTNNRAEQSYELTRVCERGMPGGKSGAQAQRFLGTHSAGYNLFNLGKQLTAARHYQDLRRSAFEIWKEARL